jgi:helix-turn-helix protein
MLTTALVQEIDRLLCDGKLSQRQIAARLGVSRGTISAIANGRRSLFGRETPKTTSPLVPSTPPTRCPHCGYRVYLPCQVCRIRAHQVRQHLLQILAGQQPKRTAQSNAVPPRVYFRAS